MAIIVPAVLANIQEEFSQKLSTISSFIDILQVDCIDEGWCPNSTLKPEQWPKIPKHINIEAHLMVGKPMNWIKPCGVVGCSVIIPQIETITNQREFIANSRALGMRVGFAIDIDTPIELLDPATYRQIDQVLLLAVRAGYSGQKFNDKVLLKIKTAKRMLPKPVLISVDGGINPESGRHCIRAGADRLVVSSFLWASFEKNLQLLQKLQ